MSGRLSGRVAVVTGGATGIGLAISRRLLGDGARVVIAGLSDEQVQGALSALEASGDGAAVGTFSGDLAQPDVADRLMAASLDRFGALDILVNNAGGGVIAPSLEHTEESLQATINNNLWTTLRCCLAVLPHLAERGSGRIVNIGAESVRNGLTDHAVYNAAKGGVHGLATGLAREFAATGITVNVVAPSYTRTAELDAALANGRAPARIQQVIDDAISLIPMGRAAMTDEIAAAVAYLVSDDASFVTGQILSVNGGSSMS